MGTFEHFHDGALGATAPVEPRWTHQHPITVEHLVHFARGQEQILALVIDHKTKAIGMGLDAATDQIGLLGHQDRALAVDHNLTIAFHGRQSPTQALARHIATYFHGFGERGLIHGQIRISERFKNLRPLGHGT